MILWVRVLLYLTQCPQFASKEAICGTLEVHATQMPTGIMLVAACSRHHKSYTRQETEEAAEMNEPSIVQ